MTNFNKPWESDLEKQVTKFEMENLLYHGKASMPIKQLINKEIWQENEITGKRNIRVYRIYPDYTFEVIHQICNDIDSRVYLRTNLQNKTIDTTIYEITQKPLTPEENKHAQERIRQGKCHPSYIGQENEKFSDILTEKTTHYKTYNQARKEYLKMIPANKEGTQ